MRQLHLSSISLSIDRERRDHECGQRIALPPSPLLTYSFRLSKLLDTPSHRHAENKSLGRGSRRLTVTALAPEAGETPAGFEHHVEASSVALVPIRLK